MSVLADAVASGDLDVLVRLVDGLCSGREWDRVTELRDRCRHALEHRGLQLWPAAEYADYRLALEAPAELAAGVVTEEAGRFALGPLWEVAASTHSWEELEPHLEPGPARSLVAHERVLRGEQLGEAEDVDHHVLELPLRLESWEPRYQVATFRSDEADFDAPPAPVLVATSLPGAGEVLEDEESTEAMVDIGSVWAQQSNGSASAVAIRGDAERAIAALGHADCSLADVSLADGFARLAWAGASGGAYGRRRGSAVGRFLAWWLGAALVDVDWPVRSTEFGSALSGLRWVVWEPPGFTGGWSASVAVESDADGLSWALQAEDSHREDGPLAVRP